MYILKNIHALFGLLVFITGILQILLPKKGKWHLLIGNVYVWSWLPLIITGAIIGSYMILCLGLFGYYKVLSGQQFAKQKSIPKNTYYKLITISGLLVCFIMICCVAILYINNKEDFAIIFSIFSILFGLSVYKDCILLFKKTLSGKFQLAKQYWYFEHFGRMYISFIAALTAFTSIQNIFNNSLLNWLLPTVIGTIGIIISNKYYKKKFNIYA